MPLSVVKFFQYATYWTFYPLLKFFAGFQVEGQKNLKGLEKKGVIFAAGVHASYIDGPIAGCSMPRDSFLPRPFAPLRFLVIDRYFRWKYFPINLFLKANGCIEIHRAREKKADGSHLFYVLENAIQSLKDGQKIWIFPEGKLSKDGRLQEGRWGMVFLHRETGAPLVPVGITGNFGILSLRGLMRKNEVRVKIGEPIYDLGTDSLAEGTKIIMNKIAKLVSQDHQTQ